MQLAGLRSLVSTRRSTLGLILGWAAVSVGWFAGSHVVTGILQDTADTPGIDLALVDLLQVGAFVVLSGALFYLLIGAADAGSAEAFGPLQQVALTAPMGFGLVDRAGVLRYASPLLLRLLEINSAAVGHIDLVEMFAGRVPPSFLTYGDHAGPGRQREAVAAMHYANGREARLSVTLNPTDGKGAIQFVLFVADSSALHGATQTSAMLRSALGALQAGIVICDASVQGFPMVYVNDAFQRASGFSHDELIGSRYAMLHGQDRSQAGAQALADAMQKGEPATVVLRHYRKSGEPLLIEMKLAPVFDGQARLTHFVGLQQDISGDRARSEQLARRLREDTVTGVLSPAGFRDEVERLLADTGHSHVLLARVDLQGFHEFNTALGWDAGNELLRQVAGRIERAAQGGAVGRLDSNQFGTVLPVAPQEAAGLVRTLLDRVQTRYLLPGTTCEPVISLGWSLVASGTDPRELMQQASVALNEARAKRTGVARQYRTETAQMIQERRRLTAELSQAIREHDFIVHYQPRVELKTGRIVAAEALIRWNHPLFGVQAAKRFMALAEVTGLITGIGEISLREAIRVTAKINRDRPVPLPISVNLATGQFCRPNFVRWLERTLGEAQTSASWLQLELPESLFVHADADVLATSRQLEALGVAIIMNDFATSPSALRALADQPVAEIKIDAGIVADIERSPLSYAAVNAIISLAGAKQARVTAQSVETESQRRLLLELGCQQAQGFLFAAPLPADSYLELLARGSVLPEAGHAVERYHSAAQ